MMITKRYLQTGLLFLSLLLSNIAICGDFLPPDEAFKFTSRQEGASLQLSWEIAEGYYLYVERMSAEYESSTSSISMPLSFKTQSVIKNDKNFGEVPVFFNQAVANINLNSIANELNQTTQQSILVEYQGCSKKGLCYQPQLKEVMLTALPVANSSSYEAAAIDSSVSIDSSASIQASSAAAAQNIQPSHENANDMSLSALNNSAGNISTFLAKADFLSIIGIFLLLGIGLSFTPCILPMVPILSGIIVGQGDKLTSRHGAILSSAYVLGMSITYALAGIGAATFGAKGNLQMYMQNPWVISIFALVFVLLSLSMFGFYTLALPQAVQNKLYNFSNQQKGGHLSGVFVMGALSALVVSPCVSAPLAGALVFISSTGDKLIGGSALFALGIGMGLPLIAIGAGGGKLVPKAGMWMNQVKNFFGVILLGVAIWLLSRIIPGQISLLLWAALFITYGVHSGALEPIAEGVARTKKAASFILVLYGSVLFVGALSGGTNPLNPLNFASNQKNSTVNNSTQGHENIFTRVSSHDELNKAIALATQNKKQVMLDFYADWCTACIDMEKHVFNQKNVQSTLSDYVLLQIDVTKNSKENQFLLDSFNIYGPPAMIFFSSNGQEKKEYRLQGELDANAFISHVNKSNQECLNSIC